MTDVIVIGAGVAGMTASLYALRNGKKVTLIEGNNIGGQIAESPRVENFPGFKQITGSELADKLFEQITNLGAKFEFGNVMKLSQENDIFTVSTEYADFQSKSVILANGVKHRKLHLPLEEAFIGHGISYCALCDGAFYKGEEVCLVGDGNTAMQYALLLSNFCSKVHIYTMFDTFFGDGALIKAIHNKDNIDVTPNCVVKTLYGRDELDRITFVKNDKTEFDVKTKALFVAIGQIPDNKLYSEFATLDKDGYYDSDENCKTKTAGLFVAGDCRVKKIRQLTTACCDGAIAGTNASSYIDSLE